METMVIKNISDFLGKSDDRYFSQGYKFIEFQYCNFNYYNNLLSGEVCVNYNWIKEKNRHAHLGTVEYIAIASVMCEQMLHRVFQLTYTQVAHSWIRNFRTKIQSYIDLSENEIISISGKVVNTIKNDSFPNTNISTMEVRINTSKVQVIVCHPCSNEGSMLNVDFKVQDTSLYCIGYKERIHSIEDVFINQEAMICSASVSIKDHYTSKSGLGSVYKGTLLTDILIVSGQMVQALFYSLENIDRTNANNIWMKEFNVSIPTPNTKMKYNAVLTFEDVQSITKNGENWKSVKLSNEMGDIKANFKMVSQVNCN